MDSEFFLALDEIEKEKGISKAYMLEKVNLAMAAAIKKDNPAAADGIVVETDEKKRKVSIYIQKTVVEEVTNPALELTLEEARLKDPHAEPGSKIPFPLETKKFGRIAAQAAKQVIIQGIREAERGMIYDQFNSKANEVLNGVVTRIDSKGESIYIRLSTATGVTDGVLTGKERVSGEVLTEGDRLKVYVTEVRRPGKGPQVMVSRTHPGLVKRLFEQEVPELADGTVEIKSIAREAGTRTKIAVFSNDPNVDAIGACVGPKSSRVTKVVEELRGEKIDIINWSADSAAFVGAALAPAEVISVTRLEHDHSYRAIVPDGQLSLAIGKEGKNARLAAKLTGCKIDIHPASEMEEPEAAAPEAEAEPAEAEVPEAAAVEPTEE